MYRAVALCALHSRSSFDGSAENVAEIAETAKIDLVGEPDA